MDFLDYINGLKVLKDFRPVSFDMHCRTGKILQNDMPNANTLDMRDPNMLRSERIPFLP